MEQTKLKVIFSDDGCLFHGPSSGEIVGTGKKSRGIYKQELG